MKKIIGIEREDIISGRQRGAYKSCHPSNPNLLHELFQTSQRFD